MTTEARQAEANQAAVAFQLALAQIGAGTVEEAVDLWKSVNPTDAAATGARWLERAIAMILSRRRMSRDLAFAYYRLARALHTGTTIVDPHHPLKTNPTLGDVRREFASMLEDVQSVHTPSQNAQAADALGGDRQELEPVVREDDAEPLEVVEIPDLADDEDALEAAVEEEARIDMTSNGTKALREYLEGLDLEELTAKEADVIRLDAHRRAGSRQSATADRLVKNGGRGLLFHIGSEDEGAIAYARVSRTGTPCGWCAMLISRGAVYKTKRQASFNDEGDLYHDNCNCYAEPIFSKQQYESDPRFALNREYQELWPQVTKGYGGKDAISVWRRFIRQRQKSAQQEASAQAA